MARTFTSSAPESFSLHRGTWVEIDLDAFGRNLRELQRRLGPDVQMMTVLKADAYGHGAVDLAEESVRSGVAMIAVALFEEAAELRAAGITIPILILGALTAPQVARAIELDLELGVTGPEMLRAVLTHAAHGPRVQIKLDTGMHRMGFVESDLDDLASALSAHPAIRVTGIYTHFANASDQRDTFTEVQMRRFDWMIERLAALGVRAPRHHTVNSPAALSGFARPGDLARMGVAIYGAEAVDGVPTGLEPVLSWHTRVARIKRVPAGESVGYGRSFMLTRDSAIATLPVGYADGYSRLLSSRGEVLIHGRRAPVVGRVSMDLITVDVTDIPETADGDPVILLGSQGNERITAEELALKTDTISYEVFCRISARVPRLVRSGGGMALRSKFESLT